MTEYDERLYRLYERFIELPSERWTVEATATVETPELRRQLLSLLRAFQEAQRAGTELPFSLMPGVAERFEADDHLIGHTLGAYRIVARILPSGGMGTVYRAERADGNYTQPAALKIVRRGLDSEAFVRRFRAERQILARLNHPHIVRLIDAGSTPDGAPYFVMEFIAGGVGIDTFCRDRRLALGARLELFQEVCAAVQFAHQNLIVHRDLKPGNVLVTPGGEPKLLDFGLAKLLEGEGEGAGAPDPTRADERLMTPQYASPEQVKGEPVLPASDVYSLGLLLYELVTGRRPYDASGAFTPEVARVICEREAVKPSQAVLEPGPGPEAAGLSERADRLSRQLTGDLDTIIMKALQKQPDRRYQTAADLAEDLRRHSEGLPIAARPDTVVYRLAKFTRRNIVPVAAVAGVILALAGGLVATLWQARAAERARGDAEVQRASAERRFDDVRRMATGFVFEFHDAIANLAGATPARQLVVAKGIEYLDGLAKEAGANRPLQRDLAEAYDRLSDIQGNPFGANVGDTAASLESMQKATRMREALATGAGPRSPEGIAFNRSLYRLGDAYHGLGRSKDAVGYYRQAVGISEAALAQGPEQPEIRRNLALAHSRLCSILLTVGDSAGALEHCQGSLRSHDVLLAGDHDPSVEEQAATTASAYANGLRLTGRNAEALPISRRASAGLRRLVVADPSNARLRSQLAGVLGYQANVETALAQTSDAIASYAEAVTLLDALVAADPGDQRAGAMLGYFLMRRSPTLLQAGRANEAAASTRRALGLMKQQTDRPTAGPNEINDYASALLTCEPPSERRPAEALPLARRAVAAQAHPVYLDTLALAYFETGARRDAIATAERALAMLPPPAAGAKPSGLRVEIAAHLDEFRAGLNTAARH